MHWVTSLWFFFKGPRIYAFVGPSGTGKSFRAQLVAKKYNISCLIDDGLLIKGDKILAGRSAKRAGGPMQAVRVALFQNMEHRQEVKEALIKENPKRLLVLGTSKKMITYIVQNLGLPSVYKTVLIEQISNPEEIALARFSRSRGEHVIPVPVVEVQKKSSSYFVSDSIQIFAKKKLPFLFRKKQSYEKTVVKPFLLSENLKSKTLSKKELANLTSEFIEEFNPQFQLHRLSVKKNADETLSLLIFLKVPFSEDVISLLNGLEEQLKKNFSKIEGTLISDLIVKISKVDTKNVSSKKQQKAESSESVEFQDSFEF